jgi:hypothetical protein
VCYFSSGQGPGGNVAVLKRGINNWPLFFENQSHSERMAFFTKAYLCHGFQLPI